MKRFVSKGSCLDISPPTKTASKYIQRFCTRIQFSKTKLVVANFLTHSVISALNAILYLIIFYVMLILV